jgi:hypothetical protein
VKRVVALTTIAMLAFGLFSSSAIAAKKKKGTKQEYVATVMLPTPYPADGTCYTRGERMLAQTGNDSVNGFVGAHFNIDPRTYGQKFQLHVLSGGADADLDIVYYAGYGDTADPTTVPAYVAFENRQAGGEEGVVPAGMTKAIVCMAAGQNAEFHYTTK